MSSAAPWRSTDGTGTRTPIPAYSSCDRTAWAAIATPSTTSRAGTDGRRGAGSGPATTHANRQPDATKCACTSRCTASCSRTVPYTGVRYSAATPPTVSTSAVTGWASTWARRDRSTRVTWRARRTGTERSSSVTGAPSTTNVGATMPSSRCCSTCPRKSCSGHGIQAGSSARASSTDAVARLAVRHRLQPRGSARRAAASPR
ncbi:hypothetical protein GCM10028814_32900 [Angustibacter aerolatus]